MSINSSADLLFRISADSTPAIRNPRGADFLIDLQDGPRLEKWPAGASGLLAELGALRAEIEEARKHGWRCQADRRAWNPQEVGYLEEKLGTASITRIAHDLKRSVLSVKVKAARLRLSVRFSEGYNVSDLASCFGMHHSRIESWARRGLLGKPQGHGGHGGNIRFAEANVVRFIRRHPHEYSLGRVDQTWFKSMVFGRLAGTGERV